MKDTILIVDDSPTQALVLKRILDQAGYKNLAMAKDGKEAFDYLKKEGAALVISDVNMPIMNGYELTKAMKADPTLQKIPITLCTVLSDPQEIITGIEYDADNYITKPYVADVLLKTVKNLLEAPAALPSDTLAREQVYIGGKNYSIGASKQKILNFLFTTYQNILQHAKEQAILQEELKKTLGKLEISHKEVIKLLYNILPIPIADELMAKGQVAAMRFEEVSVMFTDFVGFTLSSKRVPPQQLVAALETYFSAFDEIITKHNIEKIKTIGDGYMCVSGVPVPNETHAINCVKAALEIQKFVQEKRDEVAQKFNVSWNIRIGINSGPLIAGIIGKKRFAYDIWGDTVNIASRMESYGEDGKITISGATYERVKPFIESTPKGPVAVSEKAGDKLYVDMFVVEKLVAGH